VRGKQHRERDPELWYRNRCLDIKYLGVPGEPCGDATGDGRPVTLLVMRDGLNPDAQMPAPYACLIPLLSL
jgi:hypothetical protein